MKQLLAVGVIVLFIASSLCVVGQKNEHISINSSEGWIIDISEISGGLFIKAEILNGHHINLTNVEWSISIEQGYIFYGREKTGVIEVIPCYDKAEIKSFVFGFGTIKILIHAEASDGSSAGEGALALIFGPFTFDFIILH
jgi:hypothetical protein